MCVVGIFSGVIGFCDLYSSDFLNSRFTAAIISPLTNNRRDSSNSLLGVSFSLAIFLSSSSLAGSACRSSIDDAVDIIVEFMIIIVLF
jgi:hypothetical protein